MKRPDTRVTRYDRRILVTMRHPETQRTRKIAIRTKSTARAKRAAEKAFPHLVVLGVDTPVTILRKKHIHRKRVEMRIDP